ncbi:chitobiosyldiphosphodolichol beta-mannosyltransferase-like [Uloborus diversus]|uniref:chitobiosyldiphosphodolichol beta-mannosyltransferase-like n=1 Tax=Uloborus diversus TaxID=327109 RepID=UPI00240A06A3|nr:chitobiosyldiphosphodolichol beta-mannosyltransferase-like [Uloborus diversus]
MNVSEESTRKRVTVLVLGDFGRSPRMQYHTLSLSKRKLWVDVVAYKGADPLESIVSSENITLHYMRDVPKVIVNLPGVVRYVLKTLWQSWFLFYTLMQIPKMDCLLIQNPPSIPTLPIAWCICRLRRSCMVIDFHNYGYTILGLSAGSRSLLVKFSKWCEKFFSRKADLCFCVTKAMKSDLLQNWNVKAFTFYDCAPDIFRPISIEEKHSFFIKLKESIPEFQSRSSGNSEETRFTKMFEGFVEMLYDRPALIVSSTSWTEDEDFSVLLEALNDYEQAAKLQNLPHLVVAITGKGPLKEHYEKVIKDKGFSHVEVLTLWLPAADYPLFLGCADLGVSLHTSSSGLDLPMKVVDMFGCCLPVCAISFPCLSELVKDDINGKVFINSIQLSQQLQALFKGFPETATQLSRLKKNLIQFRHLHWEENWNNIIYPMLKEVLDRR